jgi:hypothetical protein
MRVIGRLLTIAAVALLMGLGWMSGARAAEDQTVRAFSAFQGEGQVMRTGPQEATYIGMFSGRFYVDTEQGPVDAGSMTCPVVVHINLKDSTQQGSGQCVFIGRGGNLAYMNLTCTGVPLVGCGGDSTLTGGAGRFANVTGGGQFMIRSNLDDVTAKPDSTVKAKTSGIIFWSKLHYKIP